MISPGYGGVLAVVFWHWASRTVNQDCGQTCCFLLKAGLLDSLA
jgi:hypothetical protein